MRLSVIVASKGREHLKLTLASIAPQLKPGDDLLVDVNDDAPWGHAARNRRMPHATGDMLLFIDDDDVYTENALAVIRREAAKQPERLHIFRARWPNGMLLWHEQRLACGNVSTQMIVVPRIELLPQWGARYEGDWDFIRALPAKLGQPVWHTDEIVRIGMIEDIVRG